MKQAKVYLHQSNDLEDVVAKLRTESRNNNKPTTTTTVATTTTNNRSKDVPRMRYHRVLARAESDGFYYPAIVNKFVNPR